MTKYFRVIDSLPFYDTLDLEFKLLKAYHEKDTAYLRKSFEEMAEHSQYRKELLAEHPCEEPPLINSLHFEEAYRFNYGAAFCDTSVTITIGKSGDSTIVDLYLFEDHNLQPGCKTIKHTTQLNSKKIWDTLVKGIRQADFWGLMEDNRSHGNDGSGLVVTGYERPVKAFKGKYKSIYRWAAEDMTIGILFKKLLDMSGTKVGCFHYR